MKQDFKHNSVKRTAQSAQILHQSSHREKTSRRNQSTKLGDKRWKVHKITETGLLKERVCQLGPCDPVLESK